MMEPMWFLKYSKYWKYEIVLNSLTERWWCLLMSVLLMVVVVLVVLVVVVLVVVVLVVVVLVVVVLVVVVLVVVYRPLREPYREAKLK